MRIETLRLPAFGPFTDMEIRFAHQGRGLHVIHGPNEAGKSTMLRALRNLLFGFPHQTPDAHLHPPKNLSVGAALGLADGKTINIVRFKRRKNDLVNETGRVLDQSELAALMGGISQDLFGRIFCIDQDGLRQGAEGLLQAEGDLGQALFAAASGIADLRGILKKLESRQDSLFRPRASTSSIHQSVFELTALTKRVRELSLKPAQWKKKQQELNELIRQQKALLDASFALDTNMARLQRYRDALRHIDLREEISRRLAETEKVPLLADDFTERRSRTQQALANVLQEEDRLSFRAQQIDAQLATLSLNTDLLEAGDDVQRLYAEAAAHRKALKDVRGLESRSTALRTTVADKLASLGRDVGSGQARNTGPQTGRITRQFKVHLENLAREFGALNADLASSAQAEDQAQADLAELVQQLEALPPLPDPSALEAAVEAARAKAEDLGNPVQRSREAAAEIEQLKSDILRDSKTMGLWRQDDPAELANLPLPLPETLDRFETDMHEAQIRLNDAQKDKLRLENALREKDSALLNLEASGELPAPAALNTARDLRNTGWRLIKNAWLLSKSDPLREARFITPFSPQSSGADALAEAFEKSLRQADTLADALFVNASSVAQAESLRREIACLRQDTRKVEDHVRQNALTLENVQTLWTELWRPIHIAPLSPREMQAWLAKALDIRKRLADLHDRETALHRLVSDMQNAAANLAQALANIGQSPPEPVEYASVLAAACKAVAALQRQAAKQKDLHRRIEDLAKTRNRALARRDQAASALANWNMQWAKALQTIELPVETTPEAAVAVTLTLEEIDQAERELRSLAQRIADMETEYREFSGQVLALKKLAPRDLPDRPEEVISRLYALWQSEKENKALIDALIEERRQIEQQLHAAGKTSQMCFQTLSKLCAEADCPDAEKLPAVEAAARIKTQTLNDRNRIEERLLELAGGEELETFISAARDYQPDELSAKLERMRVQKADLGAQRDACTAEIGRIRGELARLDGTSLAAEARQQISEVNARLAEEVRQFVRLRLASQVLAREIERFREANQGPVLEAASRFFSAMTLGSFAGLLADYDEKGDPVIKAVRNANQRLEIQQLSEGSRDQLFLALRLGGLLRYLRTNPPFPLIVDDILVNFDDQRSAATFRVLAELAASTQVLFFTHHAHLVEIARQTLPEDVEVVELGEDEKMRE